MKRKIRFVNSAIGIAAVVVSLASLAIAYTITIKDTGATETEIAAQQVSQVNECVRLASSRGFEADRQSDKIVFFKSSEKISGSYSELFAMQSLESYCVDMQVQNACIGGSCSDDESVKETPYQDAFFRFEMNTPGGGA